MNPAPDLAAVRAGLAAAGVHTGRLRLLANGETLVVTDEERTMRISPRTVEEERDRIIAGALLDALRAPVLPALAPEPVAAPIGTVTIWPVAQPSPDPGGDLGEALARLHAIAPPLGHTPVRNRTRIKTTLMNLEQYGVDPQTAEALREIGKRLPYETGWKAEGCLIHGDAHQGNVMRWRSLPVLIDISGVHTGPKELDLVPIWCVARRGEQGWELWEDLKESYGASELREGLWDWEHLEEAVLERELLTTTFLATQWRFRPWVADEVRHRAATWEDPDAVWSTGS